MFAEVQEKIKRQVQNLHARNAALEHEKTPENFFPGKCICACCRKNIGVVRSNSGELGKLRQDERMEELLSLLESMEQEAAQKDTIIRQKDSEIQALQQQLNELLNLCEKLNSENKAENVQVLKNDLKQTKELFQSEKEKRKRADSTIEECQDKLWQAEREKEYALTHQKNVEIPVEKPVLYERCRNCDRRAYQQAKERYEHQRNGLEKTYKVKTVAFDTMIVVLWWYAIVTTIFAAMRLETFLGDFSAFVDTVWNLSVW